MQTSAQTPQKPLGFTARIDTPRSAGFTPRPATVVDGPSITPARPTKRRHYKPRARRCPVCGQTWTPKSKAAKVCSSACRSKLYRQRQTTKRKAERPEAKPAIVTTCAHCRRPFWSANAAQAYCGPSCRTLANRARRKALVDLLTRAGYPDAIDRVELYGMATLNAELLAVGISYDPAARAYAAAPPRPPEWQ